MEKSKSKEDRKAKEKQKEEELLKEISGIDKDLFDLQLNKKYTWI
jgi:hypothetical protein